MQHTEQVRLLERVPAGKLLDRLSQISQKSPKGLKLFNYYKEVPLSSTLELLYIFGDTLACRATPTQTNAIKNGRYSIIRSDQLEHDVYATAEYSQDTDEIILSDFAFVELLSEKRDSMRVKIGGLFQITVEAGADSFTARLVDLSLGGCALMIPDRELLQNFSYFHLNINFNLDGSPEPHRLRVLARLLRVENEQAPFRCILLFEHDLRSEDLVGRYIAQRQTEIIRELKS